MRRAVPTLRPRGNRCSGRGLLAERRVEVPELSLGVAGAATAYSVGLGQGASTTTAPAVTLRAWWVSASSTATTGLRSIGGREDVAVRAITRDEPERCRWPFATSSGQRRCSRMRAVLSRTVFVAGTWWQIRHTGEGATAAD